MIFDLLIAGVCLYMSYSNIRTLARVPLGGWGWEQILLAVVTFLLMVVGIYKAYKLVSAFITAQKRAAQQAKELREQAADDDAGSDDE